MTLVRSAAIAAWLLAACSPGREHEIDRAGHNADESADLFDEMVAVVSAPDVIVDSFTQGFAESEVTVRDVSGREVGEEPAIGEFTFKLLTEHSKHDEFESRSFAEAMAANEFLFRSGDAACNEVVPILVDWLTDEASAELAQIVAGDAFAPTFCARLRLTGLDAGSEFLVIQDRSIARALVVEVFGSD